MAESLREVSPFVDVPVGVSRLATRPTTREWLRHSVLFFLTVISTTIAGIVMAAPDMSVPDPALVSVNDYLLFVPRYYVGTVVELLSYAFQHPRLLTEGLTFSAALLAILTSHELGHYFACRRYSVDATLPFFIPAPPLFLAGTFGAFIKIKSPIPSRRALFDIGLAGPLAGFVVAVPISVLGILHMQPGPQNVTYGIVFHDPLMFRLLGRLLNVPLDPYALPNPYYMAAWIGLLVTSLNLMPVGQLDGGHGTYAVFGKRVHELTGRIAFATMAVLAVLGFFWHSSPSGFLYTVLLGVMLRVRHPQPGTMEPLGTGRIIIAFVTLLVFALCFWPFPITIG
jgi:membrane-associated protease RseP (regulator of RpoE activity)